MAARTPSMNDPSRQTMADSPQGASTEYSNWSALMIRTAEFVVGSILMMIGVSALLKPGRKGIL